MFKPLQCATCFLPKTRHISTENTGEGDAKSANAEAKVTFLIYAIFLQSQTEEKQACANFEPQSFKPTHCIHCFLPKGKHTNGPATEKPASEPKKEADKTGMEMLKDYA